MKDLILYKLQYSLQTTQHETLFSQASKSRSILRVYRVNRYDCDRMVQGCDDIIISVE